MASGVPNLACFSLQVTIHVAPENVPKFFDAFKPIFDLVTAEPECLFFEVYQDPTSLGTISWIENWSKSPEWFMSSQLTKEYLKEYFAVTEPMFVKPREFKILKRVGLPYLIAKEGNFL